MHGAKVYLFLLFDKEHILRCCSFSNQISTLQVDCERPSADAKLLFSYYLVHAESIVNDERLSIKLIYFMM